MNMRTLLIIIAVPVLLVLLYIGFGVNVGYGGPVHPGNLAIFMVFAIPLVAIIGGLFIAALKILKGDSSRNPHHPDGESVDEAQMIQEIHHGLTRMERRIEALETILFDRATQPPPVRPYKSETEHAKSD